MNKLEKYAVKRIISLNLQMDYTNSRIIVELKKPESVINFIDVETLVKQFTDIRVEIDEISRCLLDQSNDDLPF